MSGFETADDKARAAEVAERAGELRGQLITSGFPELLADELVALTQATKPDWAFCPDCRRKVQADFPDRRSRLKAVEVALSYLIGKAKERKEVDITVSQKPLREMSNDELAAAARASLTA